MKKIFYIIPLLLTSLAACQNEELNGEKDPNAVEINAIIGEGKPLLRTAPTVSMSEDKWQTGDVIAVSNSNGFASYAYNGTAWTAVGGDYLKWDAPTMRFTAYHPVAEGVSISDFVLPIDQSTPAKIALADYMTFSGDKTRPNDSNIINLELARKTTRIVLSVTAGVEFNGLNPTISDVKINSAYSGYASSSVTGSVTPITPCLSNNKRYALVIPTAAASDKAFITLKVSYTGGAREVTLTGIPAIAAGNSYTITLIAGKDRLTMGGITAGTWTGGDEEIITSQPNN